MKNTKKRQLLALKVLFFIPKVAFSLFFIPKVAFYLFFIPKVAFYLFFVYRARQNIDLVKRSVILVIIKTVAHYEFVFNNKTNVI